MVVVDGLAASGGYIAALAADHIVAQETSLVGSIGVLFQYPNVTDLLKTVGVKVEEIKSSPLKAAPNGFEPTSPEARAAIESIVMDSYAWFRGLVQDAPAARRRDARSAWPTGASSPAGRRSTLKLVDELGDEQDGDRLAGEGKEHRSQDAGARLSAARPASAICRSCTPRSSTVLDAVGPRRRSRGASRSGARCRRSSGSTLTVCWRFGTLRTERIDAARFAPVRCCRSRFGRSERR